LRLPGYWRVEKYHAGTTPVLHVATRRHPFERLDDSQSRERSFYCALIDPPRFHLVILTYYGIPAADFTIIPYLSRRTLQLHGSKKNRL
jgi:hypothetical protein